MKLLFKLTFISLALWGCTEKTKHCTANFKIDGNYEIIFNATQKPISTKTAVKFNRKTQTDIASSNIQKFKRVNEIQRDDSFFKLTIDQNSDSVYNIYKIKSTLNIDSVIYNGTHYLFKDEGINHTVVGQSSHEITSIINHADTTNWVVKTVFRSNIHGQTEGRSNDLIAYYLIDKELSENYIPDILTAIQNKKESHYENAIIHQQ